MINNPTSFEDIRFNLGVAVLAYNWSRHHNGPQHPTTRQLQSQVEFAEAFFQSAAEALSNG